jgi:DNA-binding GntR family transcriptional regulator
MNHPVVAKPIAQEEDRATRAYLAIREAILRRTFQPGQRLQETSLAEWLGMSRTPVREAIWRLQSAGLIEYASTGGAIVAELSIDDIEHTYQVIEMLEGLASRLAAERVGPDDAAPIDTTLERMRAAADAGEVDAWIELDGQLHNVIRAIAANRKLSQLADQVYPLIERVRNTYLREGADPDRLAVLTAQHCAMGEAILAKDPDRAEALTRRLFADARRNNVRLLRHWVSPLRHSF